MTFHLLSEELRHKIPRIGSNPLEPLGERVVHVRFFDPTSNWRWYVMEYDGIDTFFGLVLAGQSTLTGRFTLSELETLCYENPSLGKVGVERDSYFRPVTLAELGRSEAAIGRLLDDLAVDAASVLSGKFQPLIVRAVRYHSLWQDHISDWNSPHTIERFCVPGCEPPRPSAVWPKGLS